MPVTAHLYILPVDAKRWLIDRLAPRKGEFVRQSWPHLIALLESLGKNEFPNVPHGEAFEIVLNYCLTVEGFPGQVEKMSSSLTKELASRGYLRVFQISHHFAQELSQKLANFYIDEREMRSLLLETYESDQKCDIQAAIEAQNILKNAFVKIDAHQFGLLWFGQG